MGGTKLDLIYMFAYMSESSALYLLNEMIYDEGELLSYDCPAHEQKQYRDAIRMLFAFIV
jgi:hypothetical protein